MGLLSSVGLLGIGTGGGGGGGSTPVAVTPTQFYWAYQEFSSANTSYTLNMNDNRRTADGTIQPESINLSNIQPSTRYYNALNTNDEVARGTLMGIINSKISITAINTATGEVTLNRVPRASDLPVRIWFLYFGVPQNNLPAPDILNTVELADVQNIINEAIDGITGDMVDGRLRRGLRESIYSEDRLTRINRFGVYNGDTAPATDSSAFSIVQFTRTRSDTEDDFGSPVLEYPNGDQAFDYVWDDRATYNYT